MTEVAGWVEIERDRSPGTRPRASIRFPWLILLSLLLVGYVWVWLDGHWVADDEGLLGQAAERVLAGELPHRDFAETYTGGLSFLHAAAFRVLDVDLISLRYLLLLSTAVWIPAFYACATRFVPPVGAFLLTTLAVAWSVPNYPAAMPSWYGLFLATFALLALLRHAETGGRGWLAWAGFTIGLSLLVKVTGLFLLAAVLLYLVVRSAEAPVRATPRRSQVYLPFIWTGLVVFMLALTRLIWQNLSPAHAYNFLLPGAALAAAAGIMAARARVSGGRLHLLLSEIALVVAGAALPVALFAVPYVATGSLSALIDGVFVAPAGRLTLAAHAPRPVATAVPALALAVVLAAGCASRAPIRVIAVGVGLAIVAATWVVGGAEAVYWVGWLAASQLTPLAVVIGCVLLVRRPLDPGAVPRLYLPLAVAAMCSLVQFPFAAPIYFCFIAPLTLLSIAAMCEAQEPVDRRGHALLGLLYLIFAVGWLNGRGESHLWYGLRPRVPLAPLDIPRASLRVPIDQAIQYRALRAVVHSHARGDFIYAGPEAPEVYFLSGRRNPTRSLLEFTEPGGGHPSVPVGALLRRGITVVVINERPKFSPPVAARFSAELATAYPNAERIGRFLVRWRE